MELKQKSKATSVTSTTLKPRLQRQVQASQPSPLISVQRAVTQFISTPITAQRQAAQPVFQASTLQRQEESRINTQREPLQRQAAELSAALPANAIQSALQRQASQNAPIHAPSRPQSSGDWVTVMRAQAQTMSAKNNGSGLNSREVQHLTTLQRQTAHVLAHSVKTSLQPAVQRHAEFAQHAVTLQRHPLTSAIPRAALNMVTPGERPMLQRAVDEATQADALQRQQDEQALQLHSLQRQLAELDAEATQPVMQRIQERRGAGNPLPEAVQRHLEQGLNHDLSGVRIHDDSEADKMAKGVNAIAFTTGKDIFFQSGKFNPNTQTGMELLAHEVTHTVQQSQGKVGKGIDPDSGLEQEAKAMGRKLALKPQTQGKSQRKPFPTRAAFTPTTTFQRQTAQSPMRAPANLTVGKIGVIKHTDGANLRSQPNPKGSLVQPNPIPTGTKVGVINQTADGWSKVSLPNGKTGFVQTVRVTTDLPDPGSTLIKVPPGSTAIGIAERYYKSVIKPGQDLRFYVNVLEFVNKQRGTGAFQGGQALKGGNLLWVPSPTYAQTLVGTVKDGSITGGALAKTNALMGNSPGANIMRSVLESPTHIKEVLGDAWKVIEKHWPAMLATTLAFVGAELLVGALAAAPEPTTLTKFAAVGLQGLITAAAGAGAIVAGAAALKSAETWLRTAWTAGGNASKIKAASKAFLNMIGNIAMAVASAAGAKASAVKTGKLATIPITGKSNPAVVRQGVSRNNQSGVTAQNNSANLIPMKGLDPRTYQAPKNVQDSYLNNNYWNTLPDFPLAAQKAAIQDIRSNFSAVGIDISHITDAEIIAIRQYTTRAYVPLNSGLRSGGNQAELAKSGPIIQQVVGRPPPKLGDIDVFGRTLLSGLNKLTPYKGRVYRGEGMNRIGEFVKMKPGDTWTEPAPLSTSYDPTAAFNKPVKFEIDVESGVQIDSLSTIASEFEVLMKPGSKFEFISLIKDPSTGGFIIRAKEVK